MDKKQALKKIVIYRRKWTHSSPEIPVLKGPFLMYQSVETI